MKSLAFPLILSALIAIPISALAADSKPDPSQYTLSVHVSASEYPISPLDVGREVLTVTIDGKHYKMVGGTEFHGLITPGDYHARLTRPVLAQDEHKTAYESAQSFEFLLPDGTTRRFDVIAQWE
ncbi:MAG: hypothetical protein WBP85_13795 [Terracidiphilus sp.]